MQTTTTTLALTEIETRYFNFDPTLSVFPTVLFDNDSPQVIEQEPLFIAKDGTFILEAPPSSAYDDFSIATQVSINQKLAHYRNLTWTNVDCDENFFLFNLLKNNIQARIRSRMQFKLTRKHANSATFSGIPAALFKYLEFRCPLPSRLEYKMVKLLADDVITQIPIHRLTYHKHNVPFQSDDWSVKVFYDRKMKRWRRYEVESVVFEYNLWKEELKVKINYEAWIRVPAGMYLDINVSHWNKM